MPEAPQGSSEAPGPGGFIVAANGSPSAALRIRCLMKLSRGSKYCGFL